MALAAYQPTTIKLQDLLEKSGDSAVPQLDLDWDPFRSKIDRFLGEVSLSVPCYSALEILMLIDGSRSTDMCRTQSRRLVDV